jgi:hypothetical protein
MSEKISHYRLRAEGANICLGAPTPKRQRKRKPAFVSVVRQAAKAGLEVARYDVDPDGKISVVVGKPEVASNQMSGNEWDRLQ